ncbi:ABC transporter substrate-binding protein [Pseudofrankia inefficax]|uniref:Extracellular solute-binding protein family 5 n=1 Tax=Pseudofrankia inefficax (strain DSM 45817 / CECT 9037 / DDB 130130 / EuI1c) TaxID=298654 RepID=E3J3Q7_PSEI1|nr:ABC transporter substrate-binding protein [Pseudofrankia inefficax]ADP79394.1 extracellular solute-binding protein family 5 [Pseudofrankia inefficax]
MANRSDPRESGVAVSRRQVVDLPLSRRGLLLAAGATGLLAACSSTSNPSGTAAGPPGKPVRGGTLKLGSEVPSSGIDPVTSSDPTGLAAVQLVNEYLFSLEADATLRPVLGLRSSVDPSGLVWTVPLRRGVTFNDHTPFTADAVLSSLGRLTAPRSESPAAATFRGILDTITKIDDFTVQFRLHRPFADFPYLLSSGNFNTFILPPSYGGNWARTPMGTGPFTLTANVTGQRLSYARRPDYWNAGRIYVDGVDLLLYKDAQARLLALQSGEIDAETSSIATDGASLNRSRITTAAGPSSTFTALALRTDRPPFDDRSVRQAVAWALDRSAVNAVQLRSEGAVGNDHIFAPSYGTRPQGLAQRDKNLQKVKELLAGRTIAFSITASQFEVSYAAQLQQQLTAAGFKVELATLSDTAYYAGSDTTAPWLNAEATLTGWAARPSPSEFISYMFRTGAAWNASHYSNPALDQLAVKLDAVTGDGDKQGLVNQIGRILWDDVPVVIPVWEPTVRFTNKRVHGLGADMALDLGGVWIGA